MGVEEIKVERSRHTRSNEQSDFKGELKKEIMRIKSITRVPFSVMPRNPIFFSGPEGAGFYITPNNLCA